MDKNAFVTVRRGVHLKIKLLMVNVILQIVGNVSNNRGLTKECGLLHQKFSDMRIKC